MCLKHIRQDFMKPRENCRGHNFIILVSETDTINVNTEMSGMLRKKACVNDVKIALTWPATTRSTLTHVPWPHSACDEAPVQSSCRSVHRTPCQSAVHAHLSRQVTHTNRHVFLCLPRVRRSCRFTVVYATRTCSALCFSIRTDNKRTQCVNRT